MVSFRRPRANILLSSATAQQMLTDTCQHQEPICAIDKRALQAHCRILRAAKSQLRQEIRYSTCALMVTDIAMLVTYRFKHTTDAARQDLTLEAVTSSLMDVSDWGWGRALLSSAALMAQSRPILSFPSML